jgi:hypothetical protein
MGKTRERWWQPVTGGWSMPSSLYRDPGQTGVAAATVAGTLLETSHRRAMQFLHGLTRWPLAWQRVVTRQQAHLHLDPDQLRALGLEFEALIDRYRDLPAGPDTRRVRVDMLAFPLGDPPGTETGIGTDDD